MRCATDKGEIREIEYFMKMAEEEARNSTCKKSQRGAIIVKDGEIIGRGHNKVTYEKCCKPCVRENIKDNSRVELCSAIHAEQMAIIDSINGGKSLNGSRMYHAKTKNGEAKPVEDLSCTVCSRIIYESGIAEFVLLQKKGYVIYGSKELNELSFKYFFPEIKSV